MDKSPQISEFTFEEEPEQRPVSRVLHPFIFLQKQDMVVLVPAVLFSGLSAAVPSGITILFGRIFDELQQYTRGDYTHSFLQTLCLACFSITLLGVGATVVNWLQMYLWMQVGERQQCRARKLLAGSLLQRDMAFFQENRDLNGDLIQINRCIEELRKATSECASVIVLSIMSMASLATISFVSSWSLTFITLSALPLIGGLAVFFGRLYLKFSEVENTQSAKVSRIIDWSVLSPVILKTFNSQADELDKFKRGVSKCKTAFLWASFHAAANEACLRILGLLMCVQAFWYGSVQIKNGNLTSGTVISCFYACLSITETLHNLTGQLAVFQKSVISVKKIVSFIGVENIGSDFHFDRNGQAYPEIKPRGRFLFNGVDFAYPARKIQVLSNITVTIPDGKTTYIVGKSGSGKSTLCSLLLRLYTPDRGSITVDGIDVSLVDPKWLVGNITLVQQEGKLFSGTVMENITLGMRFSASHLNSVIEVCNLREVLAQVGDNHVGAGGVSLSGGQRQRVALARAMLRDPPILILDESVSALDIRQRDQILREVKKQRAGRTTIILTHEYSTIDSSDFVCCMENGRVLEIGTKFDLLVRGGKFASLSEPEVDLPLTFVSRPKTVEYRPKVRQSVLPFAFEVPAPDIEAQMPQLARISAILQGLQWLQSPLFVVLGVGCSVVNGVCSPAFSYCFARLLAGIVPTGGYIGSSGYLLKWSMSVLAIVVTDGLTTFGKRFSLAYASERWIAHLRQQTFGNILKQETSWFDDQSDNAAAISALLMNDTRDLRVLVSELPDVLTSFVLNLTVSIVWSLACGWKLSLVAMAFVPIFVVTAGLYNVVLQRAEQSYKDQVDRVENMLHEIVEGVSTVKCLDLCGFFFTKTLTALERLCSIGTKRAFQTGLGISVAGLVMYVAQGLLLYYGLKLVVTKEYTMVQTMEVFSLMVFGLSTSVRTISQIPDISRSKRAGTHLLAIAQLQPSRTEVAGYAKPHIRVNPGENLIHFHNLHFGYSKPVLKGLTLSIDQAETVAIAGASGSGKSTILSLISRLYGIDDNQIYVSGFDINAFQVKYLRDLIAYVPQKAVFFNGSIRDNLTYGLPDGFACYDTEIYAVLEMVDMKEFVQSLPERLDSPIGDSSNILISGGQAQRLSIARALLRKPRLLIMDECTASLDPVNSDRIVRFVKTLRTRPEVTTIIVTHSVDLMKSASRCVVLKHGRVAESGSYEELVKQEGELFRITTN